MSNLRLFGFIVGCCGLILTFLIYRGSRWKRANFVLLSFFNISLITVCLYPDVVNFIRDAFLLKQSERGRILVLLILSNIFLLFFTVYTKSKTENLRIQFDKLVRSLGAAPLHIEGKGNGNIKPIMVVIPAFNEAVNLKELLPQIPQRINDLEVGILVIDDGSTDDTGRVAEQLGCVSVRNMINRGQGAASRLGYDILTQNNVAVGVTMDADNQHRPDDLPELVAPILEDRYDLVIGSRILGHESSPGSAVRYFGVRLFSSIISMVIPARVTDCSSGFKAFNIQKLKQMHLTEDQFQSAEVIIEAAKKGLRIGEVPITIENRAHGKSKKGPDWSYGLNFSKTIVKTWWRR